MANGKDSDKTCLTTAEVFPGGDCIELLSNGRLALWRDEKSETAIADSIEYGGQLFAPALLDPSLAQAIRMPAGVAPFGTVEELLQDLTEELEGDEHRRLLLAAFILSTWVADFLPWAPILNLWGSSIAIDRAISQIACLCRRSLRIALPSRSELCTLPRGLAPTLIMEADNERALGSLFGGIGRGDTGVLRKGRLVRLGAGLIICTPAPLGVPALSLHVLSTASCRPIGQDVAEDLASRFQPRLLDFRLHCHRQVQGSEFDVPGFADETRRVAVALGSALEGCRALQTRVVKALRLTDEEWKVTHAQDHGAIVLEALLVASHEDRQEIYVDEIKEMVNVILLARNDKQELSARSVGAILRGKLGLYAQRRAAGYALPLKGDIRTRIHQLAWAHHTLSSLQPAPHCQICRVLDSPEEVTEWQRASSWGYPDASIIDIYDKHQSDDADDVF